MCMSEKLLELKNITKQFPGVKALDRMSFELRSGEIHAICGENGAGKSTLMKVVCGIYQPDEGEIIVNGEKQVFKSPMQAYAKGVSIIFQETSLFNEMSVLDNMYLNHEPTKKVGPATVIDYATMRKNAAQIFRRLSADLDPDMLVRDLGMAQKQMTEIAKALTFHSNIIIFDEPTASLTDKEVKSLFQIIRGMRDEGCGIVYISHRMEEIFDLCDRVTVVRDGQYISTRNVADTNKDELVADMVGRKMGNYYPKNDTKTEQTILEVEHFWDETFLKDICFHVKKKEILGFAGLAGSGRTELMQALCGIAPKAAGEVILNGKAVRIRNYRESVANGMVYISEDRGKYGITTRMSIEKNITLPQLQNYQKALLLLDRKKERQTADRYREELGIKAPANDFIVENLSGGNQQKVSVSKGLALNPEIIFMDEPTRGVDINAKAEIYKIISDLAEQGLTVVLASSELPELLGMCDRIYVMRNGQIVGCLNRDEATQEKILNIALD